MARAAYRLQRVWAVEVTSRPESLRVEERIAGDRSAPLENRLTRFNSRELPWSARLQLRMFVKGNESFEQELDPTKFRIVVRHNGTVWEDFSSADQIWDTATWIHEMSKTSTLHPGDVLWLGTQGADGDMVPGDVIEVEISGIGTLRNYVVAES